MYFIISFSLNRYMNNIIGIIAYIAYKNFVVIAKTINISEHENICFFWSVFNFFEKEKEANINPNKTKN